MIEKTIAFLDNLNGEELDKLPPAHLQRFAALCHHWWMLAEARQKQQKRKSGVLADLTDGRGRQ